MPPTPPMFARARVKVEGGVVALPPDAVDHDDGWAVCLVHVEGTGIRYTLCGCEPVAGDGDDAAGCLVDAGAPPIVLSNPAEMEGFQAARNMAGRTAYLEILYKRGGVA
jgi:hypothetical protein